MRPKAAGELASLFSEYEITYHRQWGDRRADFSPWGPPCENRLRGFQGQQRNPMTRLSDAQVQNHQLNHVYSDFDLSDSMASGVLDSVSLMR